MMVQKTASGVNEAAVRIVLDGIVDPCSRAAGAPAGLSEMGMVPEITFEPGTDDKTDIAVRLIVTHPFCMMSNIFVKEITERLEAMSGVGSVKVEFDPGSIWTPDMMHADYAERLEAARTKRRAEFAARKTSK